MARKDYCNFNTKVGGALKAKKNELNRCTRPVDLLNLLQSLDRSNLDAEANDYLDKLIDDLPNHPFLKNYQHVYDILLAGEGLRVI